LSKYSPVSKKKKKKDEKDLRKKRNDVQRLVRACRGCRLTPHKTDHSDDPNLGEKKVSDVAGRQGS